MMMRRFVLPVLVCACAAAQDVVRMDHVVQSYVTSGQFMGSVLVARGNEILLNKGYGFANLEWNIPDSPQTKFRLGSMTKQFTAACILLLEERGKLKTDDPIAKYMPDAPAAWQKITFFHLLTHTSGIPSFTGFPDYASLEPFATTPEKLVARFRDKPLEFQPGEKFSYSNSGYVLLGYLIEKIGGEPYAKFIQENIFTPLGMKDSGYDSNSAIIPHRASGYTNGGNGPENAGFIHMSIPFSAGALYSTTEDLLRWEQALFAGKVLSEASLQKMTTPFKENYAFGLVVTEDKGRKVIQHGGGIEGFNTSMRYEPSEKLTVVVLGNLNGPAPDEISQKLAALAHGEQVQLPSERREIAVSEAILKQYVGVYELAPGVDITFSLEGNQLMAQVTGQPKFPLFAETETKFFLKVVDRQIEFFRDASGKVTYIILHQAGIDHKAVRK